MVNGCLRYEVPYLRKTNQVRSRHDDDSRERKANHVLLQAMLELRANEAKEMKVLNLGCGNQYMKGAVNVDYYYHANVKWDLSKVSWPFKTSSFDEVHAHHIIEHLPDTLQTMKEIWRVTKPGGKVFITTPHCSSMGALSHVTHYRAFASTTFNCFLEEPSIIEHYGKERFKVKRTRLKWIKWRFDKWLLPFTAIVDFLINLPPTLLVERFFAYYFGGFDEIYFELEVIK